MTNENPNLALWSRVSTTDPAHVKLLPKSAYGYVAHSADPMYIVKTLTSLCGPSGVGWGHELIEYHETNLPATGEVLCVSTVRAWVRYEGTTSTATQMASWKMLERRGKDGDYYYAVDEDAPTKAFTHAWKKAMSYIGVCADVYFGEFEDAQYSVEATAKLAADVKAQTDDFMRNRLDKALSLSCGCETDQDRAAVVRLVTDGQFQWPIDLETSGVPGSVYSQMLDYVKAHEISFPKLLEQARGMVSA